MNRNPDATATVTLLPASQGGRQGPTPPSWFGCILTTKGGNFDVRMRLAEPLRPGASQRVDLYLMSPEQALPHLRQGAQFGVWEGGQIGSGVVEARHHAAAAE